MVPLAAYTAAETLNAFRWAEQPQQLTLPVEGPGALFNTWFLGPLKVYSPVGILIGSAVFAGLMNVTNRHTDHATLSVVIGRI